MCSMENNPDNPPMRIYSCILIDDDPWALMDIKRTLPLEEMGFSLAGEYGNTQDAEAAIEKHHPSLILSDICMGGANGLDLIGKCRQKGYDGEFIIISGYSDFEFARKAIQVDVCAYLLKPINYQDGKAALQKARNKLEGRPHPYDDPQHIINRIRDYIRKNYQKRLSLDDIADEFFINRTYLSELFRERLGKNFVQYKNEVRIEQAKILLKDTQLPVSQIAAQCGFDNTSYFALVFRQITGLSPGQFRK